MAADAITVLQLGGEAVPLSSQVVAELRVLYTESMPSGSSISSSIRKYLKGRLKAELKDEAAVFNSFTIEGTLAAWVCHSPPTPPPPPPPPPPLTLAPATAVAAAGAGKQTLKGMVMLQARPDLGPAAVELKHLCVSPDAQRQGIGRKLLTAATQWAADKGYTTATLSTVNIMTAAQALYSAALFERLPHAADAEVVHFIKTLKGTPRTVPAAAATAAAALAGGGGRGTGSSDGGKPQSLSSQWPAKGGMKQKQTPPQQQTKEKAALLNDVRMPTWTTGSLVKLTHCITGSSTLVLIEMEKASGPNGAVFKMARPSSPYLQLHVSQGGKLSWGGKGARYATFVALAVQAPRDDEAHGGGGAEGIALAGGNGAKGSAAPVVAFRSMGNVGKTNRTGSKFWHLHILADSAAGDFAEAVDDGGVGVDGGESEAGAAFYAEELQRNASLHLVRATIPPAFSLSREHPDVAPRPMRRGSEEATHPLVSCRVGGKLPLPFTC